MKRRGNPDINRINMGTRINSANAKEYAERANAAKRRKRMMFASLRKLVDERAPDEMLPDGVVEFWRRHGVPRDEITPVMAETTAMYADAINARDFATLERIYRLYGLTFESNREHNINVSVGNQDDRPFEVRYIVDGVERPSGNADDVGDGDGG